MSNRYIKAYFNIKMVDEAEKKGMSIGDYVEELWDQKGHTKRVVDELIANAQLPKELYAVDIGPGTGRYIDELLKHFPLLKNEVYETGKDWSKWLGKKPHIVERDASAGYDLRYTKDSSVDLISSHGVFVYLDTMVTFYYLKEMVRVVKKGGYLFFDFINMDREDMLDLIEKNIVDVPGYVVPISKKVIEQFLSSKGCSLVYSFNTKLGNTDSEVLLFKKG